MAVVVILKYSGDPSDIACGYAQEIEHPIVSEQPERQSHIFALTDSGAVIVDVWRSREAMETMISDPEFIANYEKAGLSAPTNVEVYELQNTL
ncbi:hypothetical protein A5784_16745 [Mycobacterium sp. 852013-50091_SCH5140682]|uniref:hypothetical protein n=1 Tax=Mycobacterium sp. 852013-50091_SCH5140682 TaxID=1834109 RepID=UPI0007E9B76C|nr:hypothetical protein [Mycobacterium sp. 852013-50091_SCH5140682]OBC01766.1 hypothetical protein A5784_16745 [Mycobacterium sp. 852013-50091_SCH5140682]